MRLRRLMAEGFKHLRGINLFFPSKGTFLIQGSNEAGKSSLFEAVFFSLFGRPLQARSSEDLIGYGLQEALVYLEMEIGNEILGIERRIRRGKTNVARLRIGSEVITTAREVNRRIQEELHLDADTLLNSCFVEQKALEKLEGMDKSARESAVMKLLNLDRMQAIEEELKVTREDERNLEDWERKRRFAEIEKEIPEVEKEIAHIEWLLKFWNVKQLLSEAERNKKEAEEAEKEIPKLREERNKWQERAKELKETREKEHKVEGIRSLIRLLMEKESALISLSSQLKEVARAKEELPELRKRRKKAGILLHILKKLTNLSQLMDKIENLLGLQRQLNQEMSRKEILELDLEEKEKEIGNKKKKIELLEKWRERVINKEKVEEKNKLKESAQFFRNIGLAGIICCGLLLFLLLTPLKILAAISLIPFICALLAFTKRGKILIRVAKIEGELGDREEFDLKELEKQLHEVGLTPAYDVQWGENALDKEKREEELLERSKESIRREIIRAENNIENLRKQANEQLSQLPPSWQSLQPEHLIQKSDRIKKLLEERGSKNKQLAEEYELSIDETELTRELGKLDSEIRNLEQFINSEAELKGKREELEKETQQIKKKIEESALPFNEDVKDIYALESWEELSRRLKRELDKMERERPEENLQLAISRLAGQEQKVKSLREKAVELERNAEEILKELGGEFPPELPSLEELNNSLVEKKAYYQRLENERKSLRELIIGEIPPLEECQRECERLRREHKVRELSVRILETARRNITQRILPRTIDHMWRLLPLITNDRYRQVDLDPDTFRIKVYDERAGDWKEKNIFSGGTRDQMSLALRLSFALASLPQERGAAPSFLFLDEPLSSFDEQRKEALIRVITEGEIAERFDQIFVISHTPLLNPNLFHYYIVMENGRVRECSDELKPPEERPQILL
ncbi:SMC family ATPase [bacterium]|nr:SMC family ATPase [bacterium]